MPKRPRPFHLSLAVALASGLALAAGSPIGSEGYEVIRLPSRPGPGAPIEESVLLDTHDTRVLAITLRRSTELPERAYPWPATLQAFHGTGNVSFDRSGSVQIGPGKLLALAAGKRHAIRPGVHGYLVVVVQMSKSAQPGGA
ncbi:MAG: hypothetical protein U0263_05105 [Polyangiaceae bacterium]